MKVKEIPKNTNQKVIGKEVEKEIVKGKENEKDK